MISATLVRCRAFVFIIGIFPAVSIADEPPEKGVRFVPMGKASWQSLALAGSGAEKTGYSFYSIDKSKMTPENQRNFEELDGLPSIDAFFFEKQESVCDPDERVPEVNTEAGPWSGVCQLVINMGGGRRAVGTGFLVSPTCVLTAGHCVHQGESGSFFESVEVIPGCRGNSKPFGSQTSSNLKATDAWKQAGVMAEDYGVIVLPREFGPNENGAIPAILSVAVLSDEALKSGSVYVSGYPADKAFGTQWSDADPVADVKPQRLFYNVDTYGGHSGSPVLFGGSRGPVVGVHNYGGCNNKSTRVTDAVKKQVEVWVTGR